MSLNNKYEIEFNNNNINNLIKNMSNYNLKYFSKYIKKCYILNLIKDYPSNIDYNTLMWLYNCKYDNLLLISKLLKYCTIFNKNDNYSIKFDEFQLLSIKLKQIIFFSSPTDLSLCFIADLLTGLLQLKIIKYDIIKGFEYLEWKKNKLNIDNIDNLNEIKILSNKYKEQFEFEETIIYINWLTNEDKY